MKIVIIDYGMGNIKSIISAFKYLGVEDIVLSNNIDEIKSADKLILPGVGSFANAINNILELQLNKILYEEVIVNKKPILGICLGFQLMANSSNEDGYNQGLGFINAKVEKFNKRDLKVPHVGFNQVNIKSNSILFNDIEDLSDFYFTHSYKMQSEDNINQSICDYGDEFIVSYEVDNIAGVQFHPELSQTNGLKLLENFIKSF